MTVQPGLCRTWSEPKLLVFSRTGGNNFFFQVDIHIIENPSDMPVLCQILALPFYPNPQTILDMVGKRYVLSEVYCLSENDACSDFGSKICHFN